MPALVEFNPSGVYWEDISVRGEAWEVQIASNVPDMARYRSKQANSVWQKGYPPKDSFFTED